VEVEREDRDQAQRPPSGRDVDDDLLGDALVDGDAGLLVDVRDDRGGAWGTLAEAADIITTNATITDADGSLPDDFQERVNAEGFFIGDFKVDSDGRGDGIRIEKTWNALGMHATGTQVIHFEGYYVPEENFICEWRTGAFGVLEWASLMFASIYYGMQLRILEESRVVLSKRLYRDAAASMFQPLNADQSRTYIGEYLLAPTNGPGSTHGPSPSVTTAGRHGARSSSRTARTFQVLRCGSARESRGSNE
jgi:hypothetical protein